MSGISYMIHRDWSTRVKMSVFQIPSSSHEYSVYKIPEITNMQVEGQANKNTETKWGRAWTITWWSLILHVSPLLMILFSHLLRFVATNTIHAHKIMQLQCLAQWPSTQNSRHWQQGYFLLLIPNLPAVNFIAHVLPIVRPKENTQTSEKYFRPFKSRHSNFFSFLFKGPLKFYALF